MDASEEPEYEADVGSPSTSVAPSPHPAVTPLPSLLITPSDVRPSSQPLILSTNTPSQSTPSLPNPPTGGLLPQPASPSIDTGSPSGSETSTSTQRSTPTPAHELKKRKAKRSKKKAKVTEAERAARRVSHLVKSKPIALYEYAAESAAHTSSSYTGQRTNGEDHGPLNLPAADRVEYLKTVGYEVTVCDSK